MAVQSRGAGFGARLRLRGRAGAAVVPESRRAWHAGVSQWDGDTDINSSSIGIEIANAGHPGDLPPFGDKQIDA
jgi:N-acetyl-anhydromuramyl-L-alanine amidase AmpD